MLTLDRNMIGNEGCEYLARCQWRKLSTICVMYDWFKPNSFTIYDGMRALGKMNWPKIQSLIITNSYDPQNGIDNLKKNRLLKVYFNQDKKID